MTSGPYKREAAFGLFLLIASVSLALISTSIGLKWLLLSFSAWPFSYLVIVFGGPQKNSSTYQALVYFSILDLAGFSIIAMVFGENSASVYPNYFSLFLFIPLFARLLIPGFSALKGNWEDQWPQTLRYIYPITIGLLSAQIAWLLLRSEHLQPLIQTETSNAQLLICILASMLFLKTYREPNDFSLILMLLPLGSLGLALMLFWEKAAILPSLSTISLSGTAILILFKLWKVFRQ